MSKGLRYVCYSLIFALGLIGLLSGHNALLISLLIAGVIVGFFTDRFDNLRDEPFKRYNVKHGHLKH